MEPRRMRQGKRKNQNEVVLLWASNKYSVLHRTLRSIENIPLNDKRLGHLSTGAFFLHWLWVAPRMLISLSSWLLL